MQYKIPVQVENEDPILLGLSLRQLTIIMIGFGIGYAFFKSLEPKVGMEIATVPAIVFAVIGLVIAIFKQYEMTFVPFILSALRMNINPKERNWSGGIDSYQAIDV
jgi:PrgI family protein